MNNNWRLFHSEGAVLGTAVHSGHFVRPELAVKIKLSDQEQRLEEDPLTQHFASLCDHSFVNYISRFEVDLNRNREKAVYQTCEDAWGLDIWKTKLNDSEIQKSLEIYDDFYIQMKQFIESLIQRYGRILILDFHSYNQRESNNFADIDLGYTTVDQKNFSDLTSAFTKSLKDYPYKAKQVNVSINKRFPDGGHWPEWVYSKYKDKVCTITVEFKKSFMDEKKEQVDLFKLDDLQFSLMKAIESARGYL